MNDKIMMKKVILIVCLFLGLGISVCSSQSEKDSKYCEYMVLVSQSVNSNVEWRMVVEALLRKHPGAIECVYKESPREALKNLRTYRPRYVAVVEKPENIGRDYVIELNRMSREVDEDIYADFLWGIITGYNAGAALRMVRNSTEPMVVNCALSTISELAEGKWFDIFAYIDDHKIGNYGEKNYGEKEVTTHTFAGNGLPDLLGKFCEYYETYDPDLVVTASHATENNLEMPGSLGNIKAREGVLYADFKDQPHNLKETGRQRVYLPIGNCLIGNVNNTRNSMAIAWMNSANAAAMAGYVVETWFGRNGWGGLKYWLTTPGRYTLAQAFYLNQQDMLHQLDKTCPKLKSENCSFGKADGFLLASQMKNVMEEKLKRTPTEEELGLFYDRDVLAMYGDPAWDVRLKQLPEEQDYTVNAKVRGKKCTIKIVTKENFSMERMAGSHFKEEHVKDLPFSCFFPMRMQNPRLISPQDWDIVLDENFMLIYHPDFKPNHTYVIELEVDKVITKREKLAKSTAKSLLESAFSVF